MKHLILTVGLFMYFLVIGQVANAQVTPNPGYEGDRFSFSFTFPNQPLPDQYEWRISFELSPGVYSSTWTRMNGGPQTFTYSRTISTAGTNRKYRMTAFENGSQASQTIVERSYTVLEREYEFASGYPRLSPTSPRIGQSVTFTANTTAAVGSVEIDMGGGDGYQRMNSDSAKTRWSLTRSGGFSTAGSRQARFRIRDDSNSIQKTGTLNFTVQDQEYEFASGYPLSSPSSPRIGESVTFRANTTESVTLVEINMGGGDGYQAMTPNSSKTRWTFSRLSGFSTAGSKSIGFRIRDGGGAIKETRNLSVTVQDQAYEFASGFPNVSPSSPRVGESVTFNADTTEAVAAVYIDMGGGDGFQLMGSNTAKTRWFRLRSDGFQTSGNRSVTLQIRDASGTVRRTRTLNFSVREQDYAFTSGYPRINPASPTVGQAVTFEASTTESVSSVEIDMGGGDGFQPMIGDSLKTSWSLNRPGGYSTVGARTVSLRIKDSNGSVRETASLGFSVQDKEYKFLDQYPRMNPSTAEVGERVTFFANTTGPVDAVEIDMGGGDGFQTMGSNTAKDNWFRVRTDGFSSTGQKQIQFRIKDGSNTVRETASIQVTISGSSTLFKAGFPQANPQRAFQGQKVAFSVETTETVSNVEINMGGGDGFQSMVSSVNGTRWDFDRLAGFSTLGEKPVAFRATDNVGNIVAESQLTVSVVEETLAEFAASLVVLKPELSVLLDNSNLEKAFARGESAILLDAFLLAENATFTYDLSGYPVPFSDISEQNTAFNEILKLAYYDGQEDSDSVFTRNASLFRPLDHITRQEFLKTVVQGADLEIIDGNAYLADFLDKDAVIGTFWERYFNTAVALGLIVGDNGYLRARENINVREALLVLRRFRSNTQHSNSGFAPLDDVSSSRALVEELGDEYEPVTFDESVAPIEITGVTVNDPTISQAQACAATGVDDQAKVLYAEATFARQSYPSFRWRTNAGYFRNLSGDNSNQYACFFPASAPPTGGYQISVVGSDGLGNEAYGEVSLTSDTFMHPVALPVEEPANQIVDVRFALSETSLRKGSVFEIDVADTTIERQGLEIGIENVVVTIEVDGADVELFSGKPKNSIISFVVPDLQSISGQDVELDVEINAQHVSGATTITGLQYLPQFIVDGTLTNAPGATQQLDSVRIGDVEVLANEEGAFRAELLLSQPTTLLVEVIGASDTNYFASSFVDLTFENPTASLNLVGRSIVDADDDGFSDGIDNCPAISNPEQTDSNFNGVGDVCDDSSNSETVTDFFIQGSSFVDEGQQVSLYAFARLSNDEIVDLSNVTEWSLTSTAGSINFEGALRAGEVIQDTQITVMANVEYDGNALSDSFQISILDVTVAKQVISLDFGLPTTIGEESELQLQANAEFSDGSTQDVTGQVAWTTSSNAVSVNRLGLLVTENSDEETAASVSARYTYDNETLVISKDITIQDTIQPRTLLGLDIAGPDNILESQTKRYSALARYSDGSAIDVRDRVQWNFSYAPATIDGDGNLSVEDRTNYVREEHILTAVYTVGDTVLSDSLNVLVGDITDIRQMAAIKVITPESIPANSVVQFAAQATYEGGSKRNITTEGVWSGTVGDSRISADGKLLVNTSVPVTGEIFVTYRHFNITKVASRTVMVKPKSNRSGKPIPGIILLLLDEPESSEK